MHMGLQDKLQHFAAPSDTLVVGIDGAVTGDAVVDAHLRALDAGRTLTIVHTGAPTAVALRMAARFHATLVDAATIVAPAPVLALPPHVEPLPLLALDAPAPPAGPPAILAPEPFAFPAPEPAALPTPEPLVAPPAQEPSLIVAASEPEPEVAHAPEAPALLEEGRLPWEIVAAAPESVTLQIPEDEFESMPWNVVHHQVIASGRTNRLAAPRPTTVADWGLPWPRPVAPSDGLAVADPKLWHARERLGAIREDLDRAGAPSFGVAKPEGSAWLKRLHEFGSP